MRIFTALVLGVFSFSAQAMETGAEYRLNAYYPESTHLVFQPQSSSTVVMRIKKGEIKSDYQRTVVDLNVRVLSPCVVGCDVEIIKVNDIVSPSALPEALTKKPDLVSSKSGSLDKK